MAIDKKNIKNLTDFLNQYYSSHYACLVSGSYIDGNNNEYSDIDVLIFTKDRNTVFNETLPFENLKIQAIVIPVQNIQEILWVDYITCKGAFINMISKGEILNDTDNFLKYLIPHTKKLEKNGGRGLSDEEIYFKRVKITSLLFDIMGGKNINELLFPINSIMDLISEFKLKTTGNWCGDGKYRMRHLKNLDSKFYAKLIQSIQGIHIEKNKEPFIELISKELDNYGGLLPYYSKSQAFSKVSTDYLVIEIDTGKKTNSHILDETIRKIHTLIKSIDYRKIEYYFFSSKPVGKNKVEQNIYIVIDSDNEFINDYLIDRLNLLFQNKSDLIKVSFPFQFDPRYRFSNDSIYYAVASIFYKTSRFILNSSNNILEESTQLNLSLALMKKIKTLWFYEDSALFISFLEYLIDCWLVFSYDDGTSFNTSTLLKNKKSILDKFNNSYSRDKKNIKSNYLNNDLGNLDLDKLLTETPTIPSIENIPLYKAYLLDLNNTNSQKWSLFREVIFRIFSTFLIDNRFMTYIPFVIRKIELND